jgi:site-specific DNA-methyltransferase (adenine-specific)
MSWEEVTIGPCRLICGDALEVLPLLSAIGAVVTDPPYGHGWTGINSAAPGGRRWTKRTTCHLVGYGMPFDPLPWLRVAPKCILWGANHYANVLPTSGGWLVWDKRERPNGNHFSDCELAWSNTSGSARLFRYLWDGLCRAGEIGEHYHPNQKPVALMRWCVEKTTGVVLDPYMGSGATALACLQLGRPFVGVEIEPQYFTIACERTQAAYAQPRLFYERNANPATQQALF